jgi:hypothetical protein
MSGVVLHVASCMYLSHWAATSDCSTRERVATGVSFISLCLQEVAVLSSGYFCPMQAHTLTDSHSDSYLTNTDALTLLFV